MYNDNRPDSPLIEEYAKDPDTAGIVWSDISSLHATGIGDVSCSPCARDSLNAPSLPRPPPLDELPSDLVRLIHDYPELFRITTPINVDVFEGFLRLHPNRELVRSVVIGLREGFWPLASAPEELPDESRMQSPYDGKKKGFLTRYVREEVESGRFSRPFPRLLRGMASMPMHVAHANGKFRPIYNHSAGKHALNSLIPKSERSTPVDRIDTLLRILRNRQLDLGNVYLFKSDVSHAFRILPMSPYWQALQAVKINDLYYIDRCNVFGNAASQRIFFAFYSLVLWIAENIWHLPDVCCHVDDNFSWDYRENMKYYEKYRRHFPEKQTRLLELWDILGIPHAPKKQVFGPVLTVLGFEVDLRRMRVTVSDERLERQITSLEGVRATPTMTLVECQRLAGHLNWIFEVNPLLRPGLTSLEREIAKFDPSDSAAQVTVTRKVASDARWLAGLLRKSRGVHFAGMKYRTELPPEDLYIRASTVGFGIWFPTTNRAFYHRYQNPEPASSVSSSHVFVMACALHKATKMQRRGLKRGPGRVAVFSDDESTVDMFARRQAPDELHEVLLLVMELLFEADTYFSISKDGNKDDLSFVAHLAHDTKESMDNDYLYVNIRYFDIPPALARRAKWISAPSTQRVTSCLYSADQSSSTSTALPSRPPVGQVSTRGEKLLAEAAGRSGTGYHSPLRNLLAYLTNSFR